MLLAYIRDRSMRTNKRIHTILNSSLFPISRFSIVVVRWVRQFSNFTIFLMNAIPFTMELRVDFFPLIVSSLAGCHSSSITSHDRFWMTTASGRMKYSSKFCSGWDGWTLPLIRSSMLSTMWATTTFQLIPAIYFPQLICSSFSCFILLHFIRFAHLERFSNRILSTNI